MPDQSGDKTQDATPYRRQKAREEGQVARSQDFASAMILVAGLGILWWLGGQVLTFMSDSIERGTSTVVLTMDPESAVSLWNGTMLDVAKPVLPVLLLFMLVAVAVHLVQTGIIFLPQNSLPTGRGLALSRD